MRAMLISLLTSASLLICVALPASALAPGDIAIVAYQSDAPDEQKRIVASRLRPPTQLLPVGSPQRLRCKITVDQVRQFSETGDHAYSIGELLGERRVFLGRGIQ